MCGGIRIDKFIFTLRKKEGRKGERETTTTEEGKV